MRLRFQTHRRAGLYVRLHFFNIQIQILFFLSASFAMLLGEGTSGDRFCPFRSSLTPKQFTGFRRHLLTGCLWVGHVLFRELRG